MRPRDTNGHPIGRGRYAYAGITVTDPDHGNVIVTRLIARKGGGYVVAVQPHEAMPMSHGARQRDYHGVSSRIEAARRWHRDRADCARQFLDLGYGPSVRITATMLNDPACHTDPAWNRRAIIAGTVVDDRRLWAAVNARRTTPQRRLQREVRQLIMQDLTANGTWSGDLIR